MKETWTDGRRGVKIIESLYSAKDLISGNGQVMES